MSLGGHNSYFGTGSDLMSTYDLESGERRPSAHRRRRPRRPALRRAAQHRLRHVVRAPERHRAATLVSGELQGDGRQHDQAHGHDLRARRRPGRDVRRSPRRFAAGRKSWPPSRTSPCTSSPVSPLSHPVDSIDKLLFCADHGIPAIYSPAPLAGGTAPITVAGHTCQGVAESLFGLVIHQLRKPGAPFLSASAPRCSTWRPRRARTTRPST